MNQTLQQEYSNLMVKYIDLLKEYNNLAKKVISYQEKDIELNKIHIIILDQHYFENEFNMLQGNINMIHNTDSYEIVKDQRLYAIARVNAISSYKIHQLHLDEMFNKLKEQDND